MLRLSPMRPALEPVLLLTLLCTGPLLGFYAGNPHEEIGPGEIAVYALGASLAAAAGFAALHAVVRPKTWRLASVYASFIAFVFAYGGVSQAFAGLGAGATLQRFGWLLLLPVALAPALWLGAHRGFRVCLFLFAASGVLLPGGRLLLRTLPTPGPGLERTVAYPLADNGIWSGTAVRRPDVYAIVVDSYPNARVLREQYGLDNEPFLAALARRGFEIARESYANFSETRLSVPTLFNMEYAFDGAERYGRRSGGAELWLPGRANRDLVAALAGDNRSVAFFEQIGYRYVHYASTRYAIFRCQGFEDVCVHGVSGGLSEVQTSLLSKVPFRMLPALPARIFDPDPNASGTGIPELAAAIARLDVERPFFLYAHILSPHVPFRNDAACNVVPVRPVTRAAFVDQVRCVNRHLLALVDGIHRDDPDAILLLVADHGPRLGSALTPLADLTPAQIRESLGVLNALRLPDGCRTRLPALLSPVNDMRVVFACIGDHAPRPLAREHFVVPHGPGHPEFGRIRRVTDVLPGPRRAADPRSRE